MAQTPVNRNLPAYICLIVLMAIAIFGYSKKDKVKEPVRILFMNKGGTLIFEHSYHTSIDEIGADCIDCHHKLETVEEKIDVYKRFGTTIIGVALPAIVGAKMCINGDTDKGVISAECLDPKTFLKMLTEMGAPLILYEVQTRRARNTFL